MASVEFIDSNDLKFKEGGDESQSLLLNENDGITSDVEEDKLIQNSSDLLISKADPSGST